MTVSLRLSSAGVKGRGVVIRGVCYFEMIYSTLLSFIEVLHIYFKVLASPPFSGNTVLPMLSFTLHSAQVHKVLRESRKPALGVSD